MVEKEHHCEGDVDHNELHPLEQLLSEEGYLDILSELGPGVEKDQHPLLDLAHIEMRPHEPLRLDVGPFGLIEYFLEVDAFPIGPREEHLQHDDDVHDDSHHLEREEDFQVLPLVLNSQEDEQVDEGHPHEDVHDVVENIEFLLD